MGSMQVNNDRPNLSVGRDARSRIDRHHKVPTLQIPWAPRVKHGQVSAPEVIAPSWTSRYWSQLCAKMAQAGRTSALVGALLVAACSSETPPHQQAAIGGHQVAVSMDRAPWNQPVRIMDEDDLDRYLRHPTAIQGIISRTNELLAEMARAEPKFSEHAQKIQACMAKAKTEVDALTTHLGAEDQWISTSLALSEIGTWANNVERTLENTKDQKTKPRPDDSYVACLTPPAHDEDVTQRSFAQAYERLAAASLAFQRAYPSGNAACLDACLEMYRAIGQLHIDSTHAPDHAGLSRSVLRWVRIIKEMDARAETLEAWGTETAAKIDEQGQEQWALRMKLVGGMAMMAPLAPAWLMVDRALPVRKTLAYLHQASMDTDTARALQRSGLDSKRLDAAIRRAESSLSDARSTITEGTNEWILYTFLSAAVYTFAWLLGSIFFDMRRAQTQAQSADDSTPPDTRSMR